MFLISAVLHHQLEVSMNTPIPVNTPQVSVPAATPTIGALIGGVVSSAVSAKVGDPMASYAINAAIPAIFAWLFHFAHQKLGTPE